MAFFSAGGSDTQFGQNGQTSASQSNQFGNLPFFEQPFPGLFSPSASEQTYLNAIMGLPAMPRYTPAQQAGMLGIQGLTNGGWNSQQLAAQMFPQRFGDLSSQGWMPQSGPNLAWDALPENLKAQAEGAVWKPPPGMLTIQDLLSSALKGPTPLETQGLETLRGTTDSTALTNAANRYFTDIVEPSLRAGLQTGGLGGVKGGAYGETLGRAGVQMALPIAQMIQSALGQYGGAQIGVGTNLAGRQQGLASLLEQMRQGSAAERAGLYNQLFGMGSQDSRLTSLPLLNAASQAAAVPRLLGVQDLLRQQGLAIIQRGLSSQGTSGSTGFQNTTNPLTFGSLLGPAAAIAAAGVLNPQGVSAIGKGIGSLWPLATSDGAASIGGGGVMDFAGSSAADVVPQDWSWLLT